MKVIIRLSEQMYDIFLKFYPFSYRNEFEEEMKYVYSQSIKDAYIENGEKGLVQFWFISLFDGIKSLFTEHLDNKKGGGKMKSKSDFIMQNKVFLWIALGVATILAIPLIAMQFTGEVNWGPEDFIVIGTLLFGAGSLFVLVARVTPRKYRSLIGLATVGTVLWLWVELAVGLFTNWGS